MNDFLKKMRYIGLMVVLALGFLSGCTRPTEAAELTTQEAPIVTTEPVRQPREGIQTLLVICLDSFDAPRDSGSYRNGNRADMILLMVIDEERGETTALQLNPDTMVSFAAPGMAESVEMPLGLVYSYGSGGSDSCLNGSKAVSNLLGGVSIDHYMTFTADSIAIVNDMIGGVTVTVTEKSPELAEEENLTLWGEDAIAFFSYRDDEDAANEDHMERQRQYMTEMYLPFLENAQQENFLTKLTIQLGDAFSTDLTLSQMMQMMESLGTYERNEAIVTLKGNSSKVDGQFQFFVDAECLEQTADTLFF